ncbi:ArsR family transcriptional regulator [Methanoculleus sp. FWC-SCC1]|uniref:ArsR family transcriptional regulator n=1 Tax=Methanoculleus frigidifontis TaxID=2584085 RepID=A0ABT8M7R3_9EURY|nr:ArsR family transcriptional regulator [Methanoculleus sp. FWC-SCC1]MDN7023972.1 ArsR family transcriptional regulator [Methanoculleus sp. FWC-SCC1]
MLEGSEVSRLLDILGNRNRRRIIALLRQKPCFVTEISDRLVLSPKAVIEHLQLMEREQLLISCQDERRRKYYYLSQDINVSIHLLHQQDRVTPPASEVDQATAFIRSLLLFRRLIRARDELVSNLEHLEQDIEAKVNVILQAGGGLLSGEKELDVMLALAHYNLTLEELEELTNLPAAEIRSILIALIEKGLVEQTNTEYMIRGVHGE